MFYGKLVHKHSINVAHDIYPITKNQMKKVAKGQMVKCRHIWQALYAMKAKVGRFLSLSSIAQSCPSKQPGQQRIKEPPTQAGPAGKS